jgi:glutaredoxin-like protein
VPERQEDDMTDKPGAPGSTEVVVYWRPGCPFCSMLISRLDSLGLSYAMRNIWDDPDAAAFVRSVAGGNETVPTVTVGDVAIVNPRPGEVLAALDG